MELDSDNMAWYRSIQRMPYMPNWIKDAAAKMRQETERRRKTEDAAEARQKAIDASSPLALQKLREAVEKDVVLFNEEFSDPQKRLKDVENLGSHGFQVSRQYSPPYTLQVMREGARITYQILAVGKEAGSYGIELGQSDEVRIREQGLGPISFEDASKKLITPALKGLEE